MIITKITAGKALSIDDTLAVEEPLEIRLSYVKDGHRIEKKISVTMRTPGNDAELAAGFVYTEGIVSDAHDIKSIEQTSLNTVTIVLNEKIASEVEISDRNFYTTSSCGVCGKSSIDSVIIKRKNDFSSSNDVQFNTAMIYTLPEILRGEQKIFGTTGGIHGCALFDSNGKILSAREDVGRHNALDKLIGEAFLKNQLPLSHHLLLLSGRASFELLQKAYMSGIPVVAAVGAPSTLAAEFANEKAITLIGFLKQNSLNIYSHPRRIVSS
jgi:FdhD protein